MTITTASVKSRTPLVVGGLIVAAFLVTNLVNTFNKGGDFDAYYAAGQRVWSAEALYAGSAIAIGFVGPPVQALLFAPLVPLGPVVARLIWFAINVMLLWYALATWVGVLAAPPEVPASAPAAVSPDLGERTRQLATVWAFLPVLAIASPLQAQFEHQNLNIVLLALAAFGADALIRGRDAAAGAALGLAAAIKVYPVLALVWLAARRRWRAFGVGVAVAALASVAPVAIRGIDRVAADTADWRTIVGGGWPTRRANQSIVAMWGRYLLGEGPDGYPTLTSEQTLVFVLAGLTAVVLIVPLVRLLWRAPVPRLAEELACVNAVAVLVSPIAWEHYWVAFFPPLVALSVRARQASTSAGADAEARWARITFWIALVCLTVLSRPIIGWHGARLVRALSLMTWAGVLTCITLAAQIAQRDDGHGRGA